MNELSRAGLGPGELENLIEQALAEARARGVDQAEVAARHESGLSATARLGEVENLEYTNDRGLWITVYRGSRKGSASTSDIAAASIREAVAKACSFAEYTAADRYAGLADAELMCAEPQDLDLDHPWTLEAREAIRLAIECETAGRDSDARINNSEGATVSSHRGVRAYGNTHGFLDSFTKTATCSATIITAPRETPPISTKE